MGADWSLRGSQVEGRVVSAIGPGVLVLVGVHETDTDSDADYMYELTSPS
jgi:D-Tyr-tRNAtyr deacylase